MLGSEANYAGMSFLTLDKLNHLRYGSEIVNAVCDARPEHGPGLGTFAFDDEGVPAQSADIIRNGQFVGYMTSRETAAAVGADALERHHARHRLVAPAADPHDQRQPAARRADARRSVRRRQQRDLHGDQPELVHRRQALQLPVRLRDRLGDSRRQARAHAEESDLQRHHHRVLEFLRGHRQSRSLGAVGRAELRQGTARAGDRHRPRRQPGALPRHQDREPRMPAEHAPSRIERMPRAFRRRAASREIARGLATSKRCSARIASALTRFANNTIHQNVAEQAQWLSVRVQLDQKTARATTNRFDRGFHPVGRWSRPSR